ncbi:type IV pilin protein [Nitrincola alkalilacustris]|uniref:type IV pilin protein n=1 Tax=Nitrincola alkalilacustris TaxID=1571224 RepID=UPI00124C3B0D|nr:type IV pilin protein [Nitrincola alkalilacustris]
MNKIKGFTLIEVMIAVVVVSILVAIAYPSYQQYLIRGNRAEAQSFLMDLAQRQQQFLIDSRSYADTLGALNAPIPENVNRHYTIADPTVQTTPPAFTITATPRANTMQSGDGALSINQAGERLWNGNPW